MRYFCIVSYDGYNYSGYQKQAHDKNTIQEIIEKNISFLFKEKITIYASGRTDKHVHALNQTFHFDSDIKIPTNNVKKSLNSNLPNDIVIKSVKIVSDSFHSRYSTHKKVYEYKIMNTSKKDAFKSRYYGYYKDKLDIDLLNEASKLFIGLHDFKNFTTNKIDEVENFNKTIYDVTIKKSKNVISITFFGSGFLKYQVRMMVGALIEVSSHRKDISFIENMLKDNVDSKCSYKAFPEGLYLKKVIY